ncbi:hypothetical protein B0H13DRAFT_1926691 [Mycena leptocephala]|nr:hypothetical protein B0H13DRAFT_1926691 [Mycena leptocephala]
MPSPTHLPTDSLHVHVSPSHFLVISTTPFTTPPSPTPPSIFLLVPPLTPLPPRDNVLFGRPFEEERRYRRGRIIEHSCLLPDLRSHADGDLTERPKVIDLSDEQQANIVRAVYCSADVVEMRTHFPLGFPSPIHLTRWLQRQLRGFFRGSGLEEFALLPLFLPMIPHDFRRWDDSTSWSFFGVLITMIRKCRANFVARLLVSLRQ